MTVLKHIWQNSQDENNKNRQLPFATFLKNKYFQTLSVLQRTTSINLKQLRV